MRPCLVFLVLAACGGDESSVTPDASPTCLVSGDFGAAGALTGTQMMGTSGTLSATLEAGVARDVLFIKLNAGKGVFAGGIQPGTYTISGADAGYTTCGLCVHIIADLVMGQGPSKFYFADSGTVTLASTGMVMGSAMNLTFKEINTSTGAVIPGCESKIGSVSFATQ